MSQSSFQVRFRDVAQPGSAHVWGAWGRKFKSCHPDLTKAASIQEAVFTFYELLILIPYKNELRFYIKKSVLDKYSWNMNY